MLNTLRAITYTFRDSTAIPFLLRHVWFLPHWLTQLVSLAELGRLYTGVLHDLSSPLTAILMQLELIVHNEQRDILLTASTQIKYLLHLAHGTQYSNGYSAISLHETVEHARGLLTHRALTTDVRIVTYVSHNIYLYGNKLALQQILNNLIANAIEAYDGVIQQHKTVTVTVTSTTKHITITVHDTGCGIAPHNVKKIFLPLYTTKTNGTGLGLSLVMQLVTVSFKGRITATSNSTQGTYITVKLPRTKNCRRFERL